MDWPMSLTPRFVIAYQAEQARKRADARAKYEIACLEAGLGMPNVDFIPGSGWEQWSTLAAKGEWK
jgi:hypothetical protein